MTDMPHYHVVPEKGGWATKKAGTTRASSRHRTQAEAVDAAHTYLTNQGGGELSTHGRDGAIRAKDTIEPGNDPEKAPG